MSENIQSISMGSYTLGETNKLTFSAGPGIKIDEPSAGTVRIGNDETVLWSGDYVSGSNLNLSESCRNFETLGVTFKDNNNNAITTMFDMNTQGSEITLLGCSFSILSNIPKMWLKPAIYTLANTSITWKHDNEFEIYGGHDPIANGEGGRIHILKVIGINRISGSNA